MHDITNNTSHIKGSKFPSHFRIMRVVVVVAWRIMISCFPIRHRWRKTRQWHTWCTAQNMYIELTLSMRARFEIFMIKGMRMYIRRRRDFSIKFSSCHINTSLVSVNAETSQFKFSHHDWLTCSTQGRGKHKIRSSSQTSWMETSVMFFLTTCWIFM